jgi:ABC-2 type transport system permease protein
MAGALVAVTSFTSALTRSQVIAFVFGVVASFLLMMSGLELVLNLFSGWAPQYVVDLVASFSLLTHFNAIARGVLDLPAIAFFVLLILLFLFLNRQVLEVWRVG